MTPDPDRPPHEILGVAEDADQETIRRAYRQLIKRHRPERDPQGFERIRRAYEDMRRYAPAEPSAADSISEAKDEKPTEPNAEFAIPNSIDELINSWAEDDPPAPPPQLDDSVTGAPSDEPPSSEQLQLTQCRVRGSARAGAARAES